MKKYIFLSAFILLLPLTANANTVDSSTMESLTTSSTQETNFSSTVESSEVISSSTEKEQTTTDISTSEVTVPDSVDVIKEKEDVENTLEDKIGVKAATSAEEVDVSSTAEDLRKSLKDANMASIISPEEVDSYSDEQLLNAMTLTTRYSTEVYGLDIGGYARVLQALYKDKTLSWDEIEPALAYNPTDYENTLDMIPSIDQLENYLAALYPTTSSFMPMPKLDRDELMNILRYISPIQKKIIAEQGSLFPEVIAWIINYSENPEVLSGAALQPTTESSTTEQTSSSQKAQESTPAKEDKEDKNTGFLPKTGEQRKAWLTVIGGLIVVIVILFVIFRRKKK
ncbi:hypothetical protein BAU15_00565 [Enterococcus sp. JM4C]|uniref:LPXTG cell wall anchor domain-containing protein n=1 Tax=Candidatus Enterococcus huntleyi TaxID=1857217 RepID=UPI001379764B|nr:LPXTG cell wall anchor domain-containing protein [Enterococcus sp. JM4C]KAF1299172.1 hypothetical protein BAU15_00565 [Enterococcus sp. JM4C]